jgi:hypothetical protein
MMKKAQHESIGLAILIILIIFALIFTLILVNHNNQADPKDNFIKLQQGSTMLDVFLRTTSRDCGLSMTELLQDCNDDKIVSCGVLGSCEYVKKEAEDIFGNTLRVWGTNYEFSVSEGSDTLFSLGSFCNSDKKSKTFLIPTKSGILSAKIDICS